MTKPAHFAAPLAGLLLVAWLALPARADSVSAGFATFSLTAVGGGMTSDGTLGASGGLATLDSGSSYVGLSLDSGPSSRALADPVEPGTLGRSVIGTADSCPAGPPNCNTPTLIYPDASATYPGTGHNLDTVPAQALGPITVTGGSATATATALHAAGATNASGFDIAGILMSSGSSISGDLLRAGNDLTASASSGIATLKVPGGLELHHVEGSVRIELRGGRRTAVAGVTVGSAAVAGTPVTIDDNGVTVVGQTVLPLGTLRPTTAQVNQQLATAGVSVKTLEPVRSVSSTGAVADSGGVIITLVTNPAAPGGTNTLTLRVGRVVATETDAAAPPAVSLPTFAAPPLTTTSTTIIDPGQPGTPGAAPSAAQAPLLSRYLVVGHARITALQALIAFALWQVLTLGMPTLTTLVRRRRRQRALVPAPW